MRFAPVYALLVAFCLIVAACGSDGAATTTVYTGDASNGTSGGPSFNTDDGGLCTPKTCADLGYDCGQNSDGCGGVVDCGSCTSPAFCGAGGFSKCGGNLAALDAGGDLCVPKTCADQGFTCGMNSDGCGNLLDCGSCTAPEYCGGGGFSTCGGNSIAADSGGSICVPKDCTQLGYHCGPAGDGCGNQISCGTCASPAFCGGGGFSTCGGNLNALDGGGGVCTPKTCAQAGIGCGAAGDGCGNQILCGGCSAPQWCGGGGFAKCGGNVNYLDGSICQPKTCAQLGFNCGPADDGCGHLLQCGSCTLPEICGANNVPGVCSGVPCTGLCQNVVNCGAGTPTTFSGRVVAGTQGVYGAPDPVPNVIVYVPNGTVLPFSEGVQCSQCGADVTGSPLVKTTTDYLGNFSLAGVPVPPSGHIPLVIQLGRWRRQLDFPVAQCTVNPLGDIHMPRNHNEGDIPLTAISSGSWDAMECVLLKMGIDQTEFTNPGGGGRIEMYKGNGVTMNGSTPDETVLTEGGFFTAPTLDDYDQVLLPCWGQDPRSGSHDFSANNVKSAAALTNMVNYSKNGGRVFATHFSYSWLFNKAPFSSTATWVTDLEPTTATATIQQAPADVGTMYQWMNALPAGGATAGTFSMNAPRYNISAVSATESTLWVNASNPVGPYEYPAQPAAPASFPVLYTFNTPVGQASQCGRVVFSAFHVTQVVNPPNNLTTAGLTFPNECPQAPMNAQEKALEYLIWDLASCVPGPPTPSCNAKSCAQQNLGCGPAGDGCGNQIDCGTCTAPDTCGGGGVFAQCGHVDGGHCTPKSCGQQNISCGPATDGCGNLQQCGNCIAPQTCGGGGTPGVCGFTDGGACYPKSCTDQGLSCGPAADGCGHLIQCGACVPPETCGGAGVQGQCGYIDGGSCTPLTCQDLGLACGPAGDGCGNVIQCGACVPPATCGGAGTPGVCGFVDGGSCTPLSCADVGISCGQAGDGCGNLLDCGTCVAPATCGGGGQAGVCGGGTR